MTTKKAAFLVVPLVAIMLGIVVSQNLGGLQSNPSENQIPQPAPDIKSEPPQKEIGMVGESLVAPTTLEEMVKRADIILIGSVEKIHPSKLGLEDRIFTDATIKVKRWLKNPPNGSSITIRMQGGRVGDIEQRVSPSVTLALNERVLLFLRQDPKSIYGDRPFILGAFTGKVILKNGQACYNFAAPDRIGCESEDDFIRKIEAVTKHIQDVESKAPQKVREPDASSVLPKINLSNTPGQSHSPQIAVSGNNMYIVWAESDIYFRVSRDGGSRFGAVINLSNNDGQSIQPKLVASGNNLYVMWMDNTPEKGNYHVFFRASNDNGTTFAPIVDISERENAQDSLIAAYGKSVYVVWKYLSTTSNIFPRAYSYFRASSDSGASFGEITRLGEAPELFPPDIIAYGNKLYAALSDDSPRNIRLRIVPDDGMSFGNTIPLTNNSEFSRFGAVRPKIAVLGNYVYVVWTQFGPEQSHNVIIRSSSDGGYAFGAPVTLTDRDDKSILLPEVTASGASVYITWVNVDSGENRVFFRASHDAGISFSKITILSNTSRSYAPKIATSGDNVYVIWTERLSHPQENEMFFLGPSNVFLRASSDEGATFVPAINLSNNRERSESAQLAASEKNVYVVWVEGIPRFSKVDVNTEVFFWAGPRK